MPSKKWTSGENEILMDFGYRAPWSDIAKTLGRTESACKAHYDKIRKLRIRMGTWKGVMPND